MKCPHCGNEMVWRSESWTKPDGSRHEVWRCFDCNIIVNVKK